MIPDYVWILCPYCRKETLRMAKDTEELTCGCYKKVKNPYFKERKHEDTDVRPEEEKKS